MSKWSLKFSSPPFWECGLITCPWSPPLTKMLGTYAALTVFLVSLPLSNERDLIFIRDGLSGSSSSSFTPFLPSFLIALLNTDDCSSLHDAFLAVFVSWPSFYSSCLFFTISPCLTSFLVKNDLMVLMNEVPLTAGAAAPAVPAFYMLAVVLDDVVSCVAPANELGVADSPSLGVLPHALLCDATGCTWSKWCCCWACCCCSSIKRVEVE